MSKIQKQLLDGKYVVLVMQIKVENISGKKHTTCLNKINRGTLINDGVHKSLAAYY